MLAIVRTAVELGPYRNPWDSVDIYFGLKNIFWGSCGIPKIEFDPEIKKQKCFYAGRDVTEKPISPLFFSKQTPLPYDWVMTHLSTFLNDQANPLRDSVRSYLETQGRSVIFYTSRESEIYFVRLFAHNHELRGVVIAEDDFITTPFCRYFWRG